MFINISWKTARALFLVRIFNSFIVASKLVVTIGNLVDFESVFFTKFFFSLLGTSTFYVNMSPIGTYFADFSCYYLFNTSLKYLGSAPSFCLFLSTNPRYESPILNLKFSQLYNEHNTLFFAIASVANFTSYPVYLLSSTLSTFFTICEFKHEFCRLLFDFNFSLSPFILLGSSIILKGKADFFISTTVSFCKRIFNINRHKYAYYSFLNINDPSLKHGLTPFDCFGLLHLNSHTIHALDAGFVTGIREFNNFVIPSAKNVIYSVGDDYSDFLKNRRVDSWLVYQGSHGNGLAEFANLIFPVSSYVERSSFYKNLFGTTRKSSLAIAYDLSLKTDVDVYRFLLSGVLTSSFGNFYRFTYYNGIRYNIALTIYSDLLLTSTRPFFRNSFFFKILSSSRIEESGVVFAYNTLYGSVEMSKNFCIKSVFSLKNPVTGLNLAGVIARVPSNPLMLSYYSDHSNTVVSASKIMQSCSTIFLKKNLSFVSFYS